MPDNRDLAALSGTVRTDDIGGIHYQGVKLTLGADGTAKDFVDGEQRDSAGYALWVTPRPAVVAQTQDSAGLTIAATAYSQNDLLGNELTFTSMAKAAGGTGRITGVSLLDDGDVTEAIDVLICRASATLGSDNAGLSPTDAEAAKVIGLIQLAPALDMGGSRLHTAHSISVPYVCDATSLYARLLTRVGHTFFTAVDDLHLTLFAQLD